ncbi:2'-5' RNA ligase family protein [Oceanicella sp. SM1341]|uniref:2'-5' RNA ligase family protein n=1 Tax=Oceanicella sp. SM1341 TaxID=1548889 RepID=UPI00130043BB|nr:2'-5' RNA ligase family protein [Oceanicella sp. SM1341]
MTRLPERSQPIVDPWCRFPHFVVMIYVLAYPQFEPSVAERIRRFRTENEPARAELVPPHVTLVFGLTNIRLQEFQEHCEAVASRSSQFEISFVSDEITHDPFEKTHKLLLVSSTGSSLLAALHDQLYDGAQRAERKDDIPYRPHMTVATNPDRTIIERLETSSLGGFPLLGTIRALEVVKLENGRLHHLRTTPFGKSG